MRQIIQSMLVHGTIGVNYVEFDDYDEGRILLHTQREAPLTAAEAEAFLVHGNLPNRQHTAIPGDLVARGKAALEEMDTSEADKLNECLQIIEEFIAAADRAG